MKPVIICLEDFEMHRFLLESSLSYLIKDEAEIVYYRSMRQFKEANRPCNLLISDLNLGDSNAESTAEFLKTYSLHTPVIVQSSEPYLPIQLEQDTEGRILAVEKAGQCRRFRDQIVQFLAQWPSQTTQAAPAFHEK